MQIHRRRVAPRVKPIIRSAKFQRHKQTITRVMRGPAHFRRGPIFAHMLNAQRIIGLKATASQDDGIRQQMLLAHLHTPNVARLSDQTGHRTVVTHRSPEPLNSRQFHIKQANALILCRQCQAAPKDMPARFFKTLAAIDGFKFDPMRGQPAHGRPGLMDQRLLLLRQRAPVVEIPTGLG